MRARSAHRRHCGEILVGENAADAPGKGLRRLAAIGRTLSRRFGIEVAFILIEGGELIDEYAEVATTYVIGEAGDTAKLRAHLGHLKHAGFAKALTNAALPGEVLPTLVTEGFGVCALLDCAPASSAEGWASVAELCETIVFPTDAAREAFAAAYGVPKGETLVRTPARARGGPSPAEAIRPRPEHRRSADRVAFADYCWELARISTPASAKVSVMIRATTLRLYFRERLSSVFDQTYPVYEIIIIDDASTDGSVGVIAELIREAGARSPSGSTGRTAAASSIGGAAPSTWRAAIICGSPRPTIPAARNFGAGSAASRASDRSLFAFSEFGGDRRPPARSSTKAASPITPTAATMGSTATGSSKAANSSGGSLPYATWWSTPAHWCGAPTRCAAPSPGSTASCRNSSAPATGASMSSLHLGGLVPLRRRPAQPLPAARPQRDPGALNKQTHFDEIGRIHELVGRELKDELLAWETSTYQEELIGAWGLAGARGKVGERPRTASAARRTAPPSSSANRCRSSPARSRRSLP